MGYNLKTTNGYDLFEMSSMIQKAIRRCDIPHAAYAANELSGKYRKYLWKRLLTVSAEDCYGIMTKEIVALQQADECVNKKGNCFRVFPLRIVEPDLIRQQIPGPVFLLICHRSHRLFRYIVGDRVGHLRIMISDRYRCLIGDR